MRLYDYELSGSCYKVRLMLHILDLTYEAVSIDFVNGEHRGAKFRELNAFGEIPVLEDGDLRLRDAQAILVYLASKYDADRAWYPDDPAARGRISQWLATGGGELMHASAARLVKALRYPLDLDQAHTGAHRAFRILDSHLAEREFLETGRPTIADIACFPYTVLAHEGGIDLSPYPHLIEWSVRMRRLPRFLPMPGIWPA